LAAVDSDVVDADVDGVGGEGAEVAGVTGEDDAAWLGCGHHVTVTCKAAGHTDGVRSVKLTGALTCSEHLGKLASVNAPRSGTLSRAAECRSLGRYGSTGSQNHYAKRYTFTMPAAGWVTINLENTGTGRSRINAYVALINGSDPSGGTVIARNDNRSRRSTDARLKDIVLQPGRYTIEATTFGRRDEGTFRLTVAADYRTQITAKSAQAELRVENGGTVTRSWTYEPASARLAIALASPTDGIDTRITADEGDATLTATPSEVGTYDIYVAHSNGGTTTSLHTRIISYCPTGQVELPAGCGVPLKALLRGADVIVRNPPHGYAPDSGCHEYPLTETRTHLWCRRIQESRTYILRSDRRIVETGDQIVTSNGDFGRILMIKPDGFSEGDSLEALEGCQPITTEHWQCDYYSDQLFQAELEHGSFSDYALPALRKGVADPFGKLSLCAAFYLRARLTPSTQASAAAVGACSAAVVPPSS